MSIALPLFRALAILPHSCSIGSPGTCAQVSFQTQNVGSAELNQKICRSSFPKKVELKSFWGWVSGPSNLQKQFRFGFRGSTVKTLAAAEYPASDGYSESSGVEKKEMLKLSTTMFNEAHEIQESELGITDGPEIEDGGGQGGNGHIGNGKGNNNGRDDAGSEGNDGLLKGLEWWWWWWWQWQRTHKIRSSQTGIGCGCSHLLCLADSVAEMVASETIKSLQLVLSPVSELLSQLALEEIISFVIMAPFFLCYFLFEFPHEMARAWNISMGAILALVLMAPLAAMSGLLLWWRNCDQQDDDHMGDDVEDDNGHM